jgi:hypothetical protein
VAEDIIVVSSDIDWQFKYLAAIANYFRLDVSQFLVRMMIWGKSNLILQV